MARPRIVVADDHDRTRAGIESLLASDFDVVATVADGHAAVEAAGSLCPDLVVLDISMPGLNGFEAGALIRDLPDPPRLVFATAHEDPSIAGAAFALGASAVVRKREMRTELVPAVRRAMLFHAVCFYEDRRSLVRTVALRADQANELQVLLLYSDRIVARTAAFQTVRIEDLPESSR